MEKYFNTAGPCNSKEHYMLPTSEIIKEIMFLIRRKQYFVIHAARQTGKTTLIKNIVTEINKGKDYYALYCSLESVQVFSKPEIGIKQILSVLRKSFRYSKIPNKEKFGANTENETTSTLINVALSDFCIDTDKPLIIFFDEIDGLENGTLLTFLRQLRDGYINRPETNFVHSIALVGMRNIRDYKSKLKKGYQTLGSKSPFNIVTKTFTLKNFTLEEVKNLYKQHTDATKQIFEKSVTEYIHSQCDGQPWLVNAIAAEIIQEILKNDFSKTITKKLAKQAIQNIILRRDTHIDSLLSKLKEERVKKIIEPIIITTIENDIDDFTSDDLQYCKDLGLIAKKNYTWQPSNLIYSEIIIRRLSNNSQEKFETTVKNTWINKNNTIDMNGLLEAFQEFWRENSDIWLSKYQYREAAPHLILQAFLQRVINSGGDILREYAYARKRIDLCVLFGGRKYPLELKLNYGKKTIPEGLEQLDEYMDGFGEKIGWLIIFDRNNKISWEEKIYWKTEKYNDKIIHIVGC